MAGVIRTELSEHPTFGTCNWRLLECHFEWLLTFEHNNSHGNSPSLRLRFADAVAYMPPAPEVFVPAFAARPAALNRKAPPAHPGSTVNVELTIHLGHPMRLFNCIRLIAIARGGLVHSRRS